MIPFTLIAQAAPTLRQRLERPPRTIQGGPQSSEPEATEAKKVEPKTDSKESPKTPPMFEVEVGFLARRSIQSPQPHFSPVNFDRNGTSRQPDQMVTSGGATFFPRGWDFRLADVNMGRIGIGFRYRRDLWEVTKEDATLSTTADQFAIGVTLRSVPLLTHKLLGSWEVLRLGRDTYLNLVGGDISLLTHFTWIRSEVPRETGEADTGQGLSYGPFLAAEFTLRIIDLDISSWHLTVGNRQSVTLNGKQFQLGDKPPLKDRYQATRYGEWIVGVGSEF